MANTNKVIIKETASEIIVRIPRSMVSKPAKELTEEDVLKIIGEAEGEYVSGKTKVFSSIKELLSSPYGR